MNTFVWQFCLALSLLFLSVSSLFAYDGKIESVETKSFTLGELRSLENELSNPATISFQSFSKAGASVLNRFQMKELNTVNLYGLCPNSFLDAGAKLSVYGYDDYKISQAHIGLSKKMTQQFSLGLGLIYSRESSVLLDAAKNNLYADLGFYYKIDDCWNVALLLENVLCTVDENNPNVFAGVSFLGVESFSFYGEIACRSFEEWNISLGTEFDLTENIFLRGGYTTWADKVSFGAAYAINCWEIEAGFALHSVLGTTSMIGFAYVFR